MQKSHDVYFGVLEKDELVEALNAKITTYYDYLEKTDLLWLWATAYRAYYGSNLTSPGHGLSFDSAKLSKGGTRGEITNLKLNHFRSLCKHTLQLTTSQKPALNCRSNNTDYRSQAQTILGNGLLDFYFREKKVTQHVRGTTEKSLIFSEAFIHSPWNPNRGEKYAVDPNTNRLIYEGDLEFTSHSPLDIVRDVGLKDGDEHNWYLVKTRVNKFDLATRFPAFKEDILATGVDTKQLSFEAFEYADNQKSDDYVIKWIFYHDRTESLPNGRMVEFVGDTLLLDGDLPYENIPVSRVAPENLIGTIFGWSPAFELLAPQQALDILNSIIVTNQSSFGVQSIWTKSNDGITVTQLGQGMRNLQSEEMPQAIQLTQTAPEIFNYRNELIQEMETLSGVNSVVRGQPEASLSSGAALALVVSQAVQFASLLEASYSDLVEVVGYSIISNLRSFAKTKRVAAIVGQASRAYLKEFTSNDLESISRVSMEQTNALSKTIAGRLQLAEKLSERGLIDNAKEYLTVLQTGQLEPIIEGTQAQLLNIRAENEALRNGHNVAALVTDNHQDHIQEHLSLLSSPEARQNPEIVANVMQHVSEHLQLWRTADPAILFITGQQPAPQAMMPPPPPQQAPNASPDMQQTPPNPMAAQEPGMPSMPSLPKEAPDSAQAAYQQTLDITQQ
jgi:hypothetical protein